MFDIKHPGDKCTALGHDRSPQLEVELLTGAQGQVVAEGGEVGPEVGNGIGKGEVVVNAESAADVDGRELDAMSGEEVLEGNDAGAEEAVGLEGGDLGADVEVASAELE